MLNSARLSDCIEVLCNQGCDAVRGYITDLEQGRNIPQSEKLSHNEKSMLLRELKTIMAVYDARDGRCSGGRAIRRW